MLNTGKTWLVGPSVLVALLLACGHPPATPTTATAPSAAVASEPASARGRNDARPAEPEAGSPVETPQAVVSATGTQGAVACAESQAARIGVEVLRRGGHAVDAAIAVAFALAVTHPSAGNLAGGGFMVVRQAAGANTAIDYRETAPAAATETMFVEADGKPGNKSLLGAKAAGIPGSVAGLALAHKRFGKRPWKELLEPALALAERGHPLDAQHAQSMAAAAQAMQAAGFASTARLYLDPQGQPLPAGATFRQPELARTLRLLAQRGPGAFYRGAFAQKLAAGVRKMGGLWTAADLAKYRAIERTPIVFAYRGHEVITMPPPSAGGVVLRQILGASELLHGERYAWHSVAGVHLYLEAARRSYAARNRTLGDPDFVSIPLTDMLSMDHLRRMMGDIDPQRATPSSRLPGLEAAAESPQTTHFSVVDAQGNAVANTTTLNSGFGAKLAVPGTGLLLNNEMDDFAVQPGTPNSYGLVQGRSNRIEPGKRMLSSMTPTLLVREGQLVAALGAMGGSTISTTVAQLVLALVEHGKSLEEAIAAPRLHHQWLPDQATVERNVSTSLIAGLRGLGHRVEYTPWPAIGHAAGVVVDAAAHARTAVADASRSSGGAAAY